MRTAAILLARLIAGAQISLTVAVSAVVMQVVIGSVLGAVAGYYGGWIDFWIMRFTDVVLSIPLLPLLLVLDRDRFGDVEQSRTELHRHHRADRRA